MTIPQLYSGHWPKNVSKTAKYAVRTIKGKPKVTVLYDLGEGSRFLAVENGGTDIANKVNVIKKAVNNVEGGVFYINEYQHLIVPDGNSHYYFGGKVEVDFLFKFEGKPLTSKPENPEGSALSPGDSWVGPRPGIPYVLVAGGDDICYETSVLTDDLMAVREGVRQKVFLSKVVGDKSAVARTVQPILKIRGSQGGRFYVNEHKAIFTPIDKGDKNGLDYIYCGQIDMSCWFPEPIL